jgi:hypothetical protein
VSGAPSKHLVVAKQAAVLPLTTYPLPPSPPPFLCTCRLLNRIYKASDAAPKRILRKALRGVPVYVMLPLDTVWLQERKGEDSKAVLLREKAMDVGLEMLQAAGVEGVMVDVWWGIAEHAGPGKYDWSAYHKLFEQVAAKGLKVQAVMSFHAGESSAGGLGRRLGEWGRFLLPRSAVIGRFHCPLNLLSVLLSPAAGGNVGDTCTIPLPNWVTAAGAANPEIFYTDSSGYRNRECLSLGCDSEPVLLGRSPLQAYREFIAAFADEFEELLGAHVSVGMGGGGSPLKSVPIPRALLRSCSPPSLPLIPSLPSFHHPPLQAL